MKRAVIGLLLLVAGCQMPIPPPPSNRLVAALSKITQQDLLTTIQIAQSVSPPDVESIQCAQGLQTLIPQVLPPSHQFITPTGAMSTFETLRLGWVEANSGIALSSSQQQQLELSCGALALNTEGMVTQGIITIPQITASSLIQMLLALAKANI